MSKGCNFQIFCCAMLFLTALSFSANLFASETEMDDEASISDVHINSAESLLLPSTLAEPLNQNQPQPPLETPEETLEEKPASVTQSKAENHQNSIAPVDQPQKPKSQVNLKLLDTSIPPNTSTRVAWRPGHSLEGLASQAPVLIAHGKKPGPKLCITAAVHGDELNGIEVVRRLVYNIEIENLKGTIIAVPIVNIQGFHRSSRYLIDRRDLNRFFPGTPHGSLASRIAYSFFHQVIKHCEVLVDVHTGSFFRSNLPQLRGDLHQKAVLDLAEAFGSIVIIHSHGANGTLRKAAVQNGIPAVTLELGGPMVLDEKAVDQGVKGLMNLLHKLEMYPNQNFWGSPKPTYYHSSWVRVDQGGIFFSSVKLGDQVKTKQTLGTITNPITNERFLLKAPFKGQVIGLANNQVVYPGFAAVHVAKEATEIPNPEAKPARDAD